MDFDYDKTGQMLGQGLCQDSREGPKWPLHYAVSKTRAMRSKLFSTQFELGKHWEIREIEVWLLIVLRGYVLR